jgi:hypothetical protein
LSLTFWQSPRECPGVGFVWFAVAVGEKAVRLNQGTFCVFVGLKD